MSALLVFTIVLSLGSCNKDKNETKIGLKPVYATEAELEKIDVSETEALKNPGKIFTYNNLLLVNETAKGIHIYDNTNIESPIELSFISIPGNMDFSVRQNLIYADNITDMVIIDISNPSKPIYKNRINSVFPVEQFPQQSGYFECVDSKKGMVLRWEKTTLTNPTCSK